MRCSMRIGFHGMSKLTMTWQNCRFRPSPPASVEISTRTSLREGLLCAGARFQVHAAVERRHREATAFQEVGQHGLRRHELGEDQTFSAGSPSSCCSL
jgi:hypothetical protein